MKHNWMTKDILDTLETLNIDTEVIEVEDIEDWDYNNIIDSLNLSTTLFDLKRSIQKYLNRGNRFREALVSAIEENWNNIDSYEIYDER